jgi:hypothetical protein
MRLPQFRCGATPPRPRADRAQARKAPCLGRILPVDLAPHFEQIRMDPIDIRSVERRCQLQHGDPVCHEADSNVGIPVEAQGEIRLPAALKAHENRRRGWRTGGVLHQ